MNKRTWIPLTAGAVAFFLTLVIGGAVGTDWVSRNIAMDRLVSAIESSEAAMGTVQERVGLVFDELEASAEGGESSPELTAEAVQELAAIAVDGENSIGAAGDVIAGLNFLPWHSDINAARDAYYLHNLAWQAYMISAQEDPVAFVTEQPVVNQSFEDAREPLEDAIPDLALFDLSQRVTDIFVEGAPAQPGDVV